MKKFSINKAPAAVIGGLPPIPAQDFKSLFEAVSGLYLVLKPDFTIVAVSDAYLEATMTKREAVLGRDLFELLPDDPGGKETTGIFNLRASLNYVSKHGVAHTTVLQKYDILNPNGLFKERYWNQLNTPVFNAQKELAYIIHQVEDIAHHQKPGETERLTDELRQRVEKRTLDLQKTLKEIEDYKYALDESSIVAITDQKGVINYANDNFCKISKYSREELIGQDHRIINSGHHPKEFIKNLWVTIANGKIWKGELKNKARDGTIYWVDTTIVPFLDEKGKPYQYVAIRSDITERKKLEERQALFASIVNSSDDAILSKTLEGIIMTWNHGAEKIFGYSSKEIIGKPISILIPSQFQNEEKEIIEKIRAGNSIDHYETKRIRKDGKVIDVSLTISPIKDSLGNIIGASKISRDITDRKEAEEEIKKLNAELEEKVIKRTDELQVANGEMEAFTYSVSHDLRAPLRGILGFANILEEDYSSKLDDEAKRITGVIKNSALKMGQLIDDLLAFSRMGKQEITKTQVNTEKLLHGVIDELVHLSKGPHKISWDMKPLPPVNADMNTIRQVWINLISNAIKYSSNKELPRIEIGAKTGEDQVLFYVKDNGVGFDEAYKYKLFKVFQRLHDADEFEGTGVGLALVERIVSKHGGKVWAEGKEDEGACFYFSLPD